MNPTERTLEVLEYLMAAGPGPVKQVSIARDCDMAPATVNRIIKTLSERGYLFRTSEKYCVRNFRLERNVPMSEAYLAKLEDSLKEITDALGVSVEVVVAAGHELLWHTKTAHPNPSVFIEATPGFRRGLYELDALSRLYLSRLDKRELEARFFAEGFFVTGYLAERKIEWLTKEQTNERIASARGEDFAYDLSPNHKGIRRFATCVTEPDGRFLHLLSIADSVRPNEDEASLVSLYRQTLLEARDGLLKIATRERATQYQPPKFSNDTRMKSGANALD